MPRMNMPKKNISTTEAIIKAPRPVFFIHGDQDEVVPSAMSRELYLRAQEPKMLWIVAGAKHLQCQKIAGKLYRDRIDDFFSAALAAPKNKG